MNRDELLRENAALRERLSRLSEASMRINESIGFDTMLQECQANSLGPRLSDLFLQPGSSARGRPTQAKTPALSAGVR